MKLTVNQPTEIEVDAIHCVVPVKYGEEFMPGDFPHRKGDVWDITIDLETSTIRDWPEEVFGDISMEVRDGGCYYLLGPDGEIVATLDDDYVPDCLPNECGDYFEMQIDGTGRITNWTADTDDIRYSFFGDNGED